MQPTENAIFTANLDDVTTMGKILQELHQDDDSVLIINHLGLRLITAGEKTFQISAYFASNTFKRFHFDGNYDQIIFKFMLRDFIESLNLLRDDPIDGNKGKQEDGQRAPVLKTSLYIQYLRQGQPLRFRLENSSNYVISCELKSFSLANESMFSPLGFSEDDETAVILFNSKKLYEYVSGLDLVSSEYVHLVMCSGDVPMKLTTKSTILGEVELEITRNETEIIRGEIKVSENCLFSFSYRTQFMRPALEALKNSTYTQMKCGSIGLLCIEHFQASEKRVSNQYPAPDIANNCSQTTTDFMSLRTQTDFKRTSLEYFILSEAKIDSQ